jgi:uncharacterized membrane protein YjjB (DUF3815 family)
MTQRARYVFAGGNALVATLLLSIVLTLAMRQWLIDVLVSLTALVLYLSALKAALNPAAARRWLRLGATTLLVVGVTFITLAILTFAFLTGVHGQLLRHGTETLLLIVGASVPYLLVYPVIQLFWTAQEGEAA